MAEHGAFPWVLRHRLVADYAAAYTSTAVAETRLAATDALTREPEHAARLATEALNRLLPCVTFDATQGVDSLSRDAGQAYTMDAAQWIAAPRTAATRAARARLLFRANQGVDWLLTTPEMHAAIAHAARSSGVIAQWERALRALVQVDLMRPDPPATHAATIVPPPPAASASASAAAEASMPELARLCEAAESVAHDPAATTPQALAALHAQIDQWVALQERPGPPTDGAATRDERASSDSDDGRDGARPTVGDAAGDRVPPRDLRVEASIEGLFATVQRHQYTCYLKRFEDRGTAFQHLRALPWRERLETYDALWTCAVPPRPGRNEPSGSLFNSDVALHTIGAVVCDPALRIWRAYRVALADLLMQRAARLDDYVAAAIAAAEEQ